MIFNKLINLDKNTKDVFLKSSSTVLIQIIGISARLLTSIFLGRILGASGLGDVNLINQVITVLIVVSMFGMDHVLVKKISIGFFDKNRNSIGNTIYSSLIINISIAIVLTVLGVLGAGFISDLFSTPKIKTPLTLSVLVLVPQTISTIFSCVVNGFDKIWQSRLLKDFSTSLFVLFGLGISWALNIRIDIFSVILIYVIARMLTFMMATLYLKKIFKPIFIKGAIDKSMLKMAKPLFFVSATTLLTSSVDIFMLGWLTDSSNIGLYTVTTRLVLFIAFFLQITNSAISPKIATFFAKNQIKEINVMVRQVTFWLIIIGVLSTLFFLLFGHSILGLWGDEFKEAYYCLIILCFGQLVNISTGCSGVLLIMSGNERVFSIISVIFLILNIILNYILINLYGIVGAAIATSTSIILENILRVIIAKKKTGILTTPIRFRK